MPDEPESLKSSQSNEVQPVEAPDESAFDPSETLPVAPPNFRERLLAAQRARNTEIRPSVEIPVPGSRPPSLEDAFQVMNKAKQSEANTTGTAAAPEAEIDLNS